MCNLFVGLGVWGKKLLLKSLQPVAEMLRHSHGKTPFRASNRCHLKVFEI